MRCDICGSSDSVFFIQPEASGGELRLCRACAVERGYAAGGDGFGARLGAPSGREGAPADACPRCGWTSDRLRSSGRLGCDECVNAFRRDILYLLKRSGAAGPYDGKVSRRPSSAGPGGESLAGLASSLERAIRAEDFEAAAAIRDKLRAASERSAR